MSQIDNHTVDNHQIDNHQIDNHQIDYSRIPTKTSIGIILCRKNVNTGRPEVLLAHKRYTYAFADFVHGKYVRSRIGSNAMLRYIAPLFDMPSTLPSFSSGAVAAIIILSSLGSTAK